MVKKNSGRNSRTFHFCVLFCAACAFLRNFLTISIYCATFRARFFKKFFHFFDFFDKWSKKNNGRNSRTFHLCVLFCAACAFLRYFLTISIYCATFRARFLKKIFHFFDSFDKWSRTEVTHRPCSFL